MRPGHELLHGDNMTSGIYNNGGSRAVDQFHDQRKFYVQHDFR